MFRRLDFLLIFTFILQASSFRLGNTINSGHEPPPDENDENSTKIHRETLTMELFRRINVTEETDGDNKTEFSPSKKNNYIDCLLIFGEKNQTNYVCDISKNFLVIWSERKRQLRETLAERLGNPTLKNVINRIKGLWGHSVRKLKQLIRAKRGQTLHDDVEEPGSQNDPQQTAELEDKENSSPENTQEEKEQKGDDEEKKEDDVPETTPTFNEAEISTEKADVVDEKVDDKIDGNEKEEPSSLTEPEVANGDVNQSIDTVDKEETTRPDAVQEQVEQHVEEEEEDDDEKVVGGAETDDKKEENEQVVSGPESHEEDEKVVDGAETHEENEEDEKVEGEVETHEENEEDEKVEGQVETHEENEEDEKVEGQVETHEENEEDENVVGGEETHEENEEDEEEETADAASPSEDRPDDVDTEVDEDDEKVPSEEGTDDVDTEVDEDDEKDPSEEGTDDEEEDVDETSDEDEKADEETVEKDEQDESVEVPDEADGADDDDENDEESDEGGQEEEISDAGEEDSDNETGDNDTSSEESEDSDEDEEDEDKETEDETGDETESEETEESDDEEHEVGELESEEEYVSIISPQGIWNFFVAIKDIIVDTGDYLLSLLFKNMKHGLRKYRIEDKFEKQLNLLADSRNLDSKKALEILLKKIRQQFGRSYELELVKFLKELRDEYLP